MTVDNILKYHTEPEINDVNMELGLKSSKACVTIVRRCQTAFKSGHTRPIEYRRKQLQQLWCMIDENREQLAKAVYDDLRKSRFEVIIGEITTTLEDINYCLENLDKWTKDEYTTPNFINRVGATCHMRKEPKGVTLLIAPWNYPVHLSLSPLIGAIAAGCTAILKPSELSVHTARLITELFQKYLDRDAYQVVNGAVKETSFLLEEYKWNHIFYTGSGAVAKIIMKTASKDLTSLTMELGGKSPCFIDENCNLAVAAKRIVFGKCFNSGQTCLAPDYVVITENVEERFITEVCRSVKEFFGDNIQSSPDYGRMINNRHFHRAMNLLKASNSENQVINGEADETDLFIPPVVIRDCDRDDKLMQDELFAPFLPMIRVRDVDDAIEFVNSKDDPLVLYIFSEDKKYIKKVLDNTRSGGVLINDTLMHVTENSMPFGGIGPSGMGSYHGKASFDTFTHVRSTMTQNLSPLLEKAMVIRYPPYTEQKFKLALLVMRTIPKFKKGFLAKRLKWWALTILCGIVGVFFLF
ncbi:aldehyde dehydrogenase 3, member A2 [Gryganskiella cystojenkinii]|nr:aldehyde dehydrogenase 3, member A2 [Gryganskiella cystojenkinii]